MADVVGDVDVITNLESDQTLMSPRVGSGWLQTCVCVGGGDMGSQLGQYVTLLAVDVLLLYM